jgi:GNAT superfamily N-acetyltransferase
MEILSYFETKNPAWWLKKIGESDWTGGQYLYDLLREGKFHDLTGTSSQLLLLVDGSSLASFCTYAERDDIPDSDLTPWMGFVYTFPAYRGRRLTGKLIRRVKELARADGKDAVYIATDHVGLYEKYGAVFLTEAKDARGGDSRIYQMDTYGFAGWEGADVSPRISDYPGIRTPKDLYNALWTLWSADTCAPRMRQDWSEDNRTLGQCSVTAFLAQDLFGGKIYGIPLPEGGFHCYNVVGDCVFDLTSEQFGGKKLSYTGNPEQLRYEHFRKEEKRQRYETLKARLRAYTAVSGKNNTGE